MAAPEAKSPSPCMFRAAVTALFDVGDEPHRALPDLFALLRAALAIECPACTAGADKFVKPSKHEIAFALLSRGEGATVGMLAGNDRLEPRGNLRLF